MKIYDVRSFQGFCNKKKISTTFEKHFPVLLIDRYWMAYVTYILYVCLETDHKYKRIHEDILYPFRFGYEVHFVHYLVFYVKIHFLWTCWTFSSFSFFFFILGTVHCKNFFNFINVPLELLDSCFLQNII